MAGSYDNSLRIRVGASLDANVRTVYRPLIDVTRKAASDIKAIWDKLALSVFASFNTQAQTVTAATSRIASSHQNMSRVAGSSIDQVRSRYFDLAKAARQGLDITALSRAAESELSRVERAAARAQLGLGGTRSKYAERTGYWSMRYFDNSVRSGIGFAQSIARGAGLDFNLGSMVQSVSQQQKLATDISNEAYMPNGSVVANQRRVSGAEIRGDTNAVADRYGFDRQETLSALQGFVGKTGDLQAGRDSLDAMAKLSRATGSNMEDMVAASADISNQLGDMPGKGKEVERIMMAIAGQAKTGAISIRDLPNTMSKIVAQSHNFAIDPAMKAIFGSQGITTQTGMAIASMGILAQATRHSGQATSAGTATQDAMAFIRDASSASEMKRWSAQGLNVFADKGHTQIRDPKQLILEALDYAKGDLGKLRNLFPNRQSLAVATSFIGAYNGAGGGQAGRQAASDQYDLLARSSMGDEEVGKAVQEAMKETIPQVQIFKNHLQDTAEKIAGKVLPSFERLEPTILRLTETFGNAVAWASDNPGKAIAAAIVASIARAGVENAFRGAVEGVLKGATSGSGARTGFLGGIGVMGNVMAGMTIASVAITTATIGMALIDAWGNNAADANRAEVAAGIQTENHIMGTEIGPDGKFTKLTQEEQRKKVEADREVAQKIADDMLEKKRNIDTNFNIGEASEEDRNKADRDYERQIELLSRMDQSLNTIANHGAPWRMPMRPPSPASQFNVTDPGEDAP